MHGGGMLARELLAAHGPEAICRMVLVDAVQGGGP